MTRSDLSSYDLPDTPGVYRFLKGKEVLYIGRATSLRDRVRSYFSADLIATRGSRIVDMVTKADTLAWTECDSVLEAIIEEALCIKKYQPSANVKERDDKSFVHIVITDEMLPRVLMVRARDLPLFVQEHTISHEFGPFPSGSALREALRIIRKIFPFYDGARPVGARGKDKHSHAAIEFYRQIKRAPEEVDHERYRQNIRHITLFFSGKKKRVLEELERVMKRAAKEERFEDAREYKRQLFALTHIQDVSLIKEELKRTPNVRIEAYDVAHTSGVETVGVMVVVKDGEPLRSAYRTFRIRTTKNDDIGSLRELLSRRFTHHEWKFPQLIVVDGGRTHKRAAEELIASLSLPIPVVAVVKDEHHRPRQILGKSDTIIPERDIILGNAEAHRFALLRHRKRRSKLK